MRPLHTRVDSSHCFTSTRSHRRCRSLSRRWGGPGASMPCSRFAAQSCSVETGTPVIARTSCAVSITGSLLRTLMISKLHLSPPVVLIGRSWRDHEARLSLIATTDATSISKSSERDVSASPMHHRRGDAVAAAVICSSRVMVRAISRPRCCSSQRTPQSCRCARAFAPSQRRSCGDRMLAVSAGRLRADLCDAIGLPRGHCSQRAAANQERPRGCLLLARCSPEGEVGPAASLCFGHAADHVCEASEAVDTPGYCDESR